MVETKIKFQENKYSNWFAWNLKHIKDENIIKIRALIMFTCLLLGYAIFQLAWNSVNQANSTGHGPVNSLYPTSAADPTISRISNWSVTITRGATAVLIGLLINKIGHKNGVIFGFSLMILSLPFAFTMEMKESMLNSGISEEVASKTSYGIFIVFRLFLAVGGTCVLICTAPIIARFFATPKQRNVCAKVTTAPAQLAGIVASLLFVNAATKNGIAGQWNIIGIALIGVVAVLLGVYLVFGIAFKVSQPQSGQQKELADQVKASSIYKDKRMWLVVIASSFSLYAGIEPASGVLNNFWNRTPANVSLFWDASTGMALAGGNAGTIQFIWQILYSLGLYTGLLTVARWTNTKYSLSKYYGFITALGLSFFALSYGMGAISLVSGWAIALNLIFCIIGASMVLGVQSLISINAYRWKYNVSQITQFTSFSWTHMYIAYTILDIMTSYVGTAGIISNPSTYGDLLSINPNLLYNQDIFYVIVGNGSSSGAAAEKIYGYEAFLYLRNNLLGFEYTLTNGVLTSTAKATVVNGTSISNTLAYSNLSNQYVGQIITIAVVPLCAPIISLFLKNNEGEINFSFKHFKENHMHFNPTKKFCNKVFKTHFKIKEITEQTI